MSKLLLAIYVSSVRSAGQNFGPHDFLFSNARKALYYQATSSALTFAFWYDSYNIQDKKISDAPRLLINVP